MEARRLALSYAPKAIERLAEMLDSDDERVVVAAAEGLLDRAGLKPFSTEPERHEVITASVDVEATRLTLAARLAALVTGQQEDHQESALAPGVVDAERVLVPTTKKIELSITKTAGGIR
jgi:hypothetical protein